MKPEDKAVVQQALEVIETPIHEQPFMAKQKAITALHQLLEQPEQEPDEWPTGCPECGMDSGCDCDSGTWNPPAQPAVLSLEDSLKVTKVCCGDYANCHAPCTPRGRWQAHQEPAAWVGLTDEEIWEVIRPLCDTDRVCTAVITIGIDEYRAIEAKLKEKNGGAA